VTGENDTSTGRLRKRWKIVSPQLKPGAPPDPTSRPRQLPPEIEVVKKVPLSSMAAPERQDAAPSGRYPRPKEDLLAKAVKQAVRQGWTAEVNGKGGHQLRVAHSSGRVVFVPVNFTGSHLITKVISDFRRAGVAA
jgi:hypothetical protein